MIRRTFSEQGSALMYVLMTMTVLLALSAATLRPVSDQFVSTYHTAAWQEALLAAEAGVDVATLQLRQMTVNRAMLWPQYDYPENPVLAPLTGWPAPWTFTGDGKYRATQTFSHAGQGGTAQKVDVVIDAPPHLKDPVSGWQYYRIRSTGTMYMRGTTRAAGDKRDLGLRKFSTNWKRPTGDPDQDKELIASGGQPVKVDRPQVTRTVEVIVRPSSAFPVALLSKTLTTITNHNVVIDSYDSDDTEKSTNGQYDESKRQMRGDVATNGALIAAGDAHIYGNVSTNGGTVTGVDNIEGSIRDDFWQDMPDAPLPNWAGGTFTPVLVTSTMSLVGSPNKAAPARYKMSAINLSGQEVLSLKTAIGSPNVPNYIELHVTGDFSMTGQTQLRLANNVYATVYVAGSMNISGNGLGNELTPNQDYARPANLTIYGLTPATGVSQSIKLNGNAQIQSAIYAPHADVTVLGGGSDGSISGSIVGKTAFLNGVTSLHYDEALNRRGMVVGFRIASWVEDTR